jgi:hypothetical protein
VKKALVVLLVLAACRRSLEDRRSRLSPPPPKGQARVPVLHKEAPTQVPKPRGVSTPSKCAGDGSYEQAVECFRMSSGFRFRVASPAVNGSGLLQRPRIGEERVTLGDWTAEAKAGVIVWTRGGKPATPSPELERLFQRLTLYLDPQKKEGAPQLVDANGNANHYRFTDANSGEAYDAYVAKDDGRLVELRAGKADIAFQ